MIAHQITPLEAPESQARPAAIQILNNFADVHTYLAHRASLLPESGTDDVFASLAWFELLFEHGLTPPPGQPAPTCRLVLAHDSARQRLRCLPLLLHRQRLSSLSNYYSSLYSGLVWAAPDALAVPASEPLTESEARMLCLGIRQHFAHCAVIDLHPLAAESAFFKQMQAALAQAGYWVDSYFCFGNWYLAVAGRSFADYAASLPSALRHSIERGQRRLTRHGSWQIRIHQAADATLDAAIAAFVQVYAQSWKTAEPNPAFMSALIRLAAAQGWLRLGVLTLNAQPVAAQLWLVKGRRAHIFKLAYVIGFKRFSPGSVLTWALMRQVMDVDQVQEVDYLSGDDAYKRDWMSHRRERRGLIAFAPNTAEGWWQAARHFGRQWGKAWAKQLCSRGTR